MYDAPSAAVTKLYQRMFDFGEVLLLGDRGPGGIGVPTVEQAFQHHPTIVDVAVVGQIDPTHATMSQATDHFVLAAHQ
jgi:hypothetical protein